MEILPRPFTEIIPFMRQQSKCNEVFQWILRSNRNLFYFRLFKDTHKEKAPSNKTPTIPKIMNVNIWVVGTPNQFFIQGS